MWGRLEGSCESVDDEDSSLCTSTYNMCLLSLVKRLYTLSNCMLSFGTDFSNAWMPVLPFLDIRHLCVKTSARYGENEVLVSLMTLSSRLASLRTAGFCSCFGEPRSTSCCAGAGDGAGFRTAPPDAIRSVTRAYAGSRSA